MSLLIPKINTRNPRIPNVMVALNHCNELMVEKKIGHTIAITKNAITTVFDAPIIGISSYVSYITAQ